MLTGGNGRLIRFARTGANAMCNLPPLLYDCELSNLSLLTWQSHCSASCYAFEIDRMESNYMHAPNLAIAAGVTASTAMTDAVYVLFSSAVSARHRISAANWSSLWYMLSAFAVISYTGNPTYVVFAALGSWLGAFSAVTWLKRKDPRTEPNVRLTPL